VSGKLRLTSVLHYWFFSLTHFGHFVRNGLKAFCHLSFSDNIWPNWLNFFRSVTEKKFVLQVVTYNATFQDLIIETRTTPRGAFQSPGLTCRAVYFERRNIRKWAAKETERFYRRFWCRWSRETVFSRPSPTYRREAQLRQRWRVGRQTSACSWRSKTCSRRSHHLRLQIHGWSVVDSWRKKRFSVTARHLPVTKSVLRKKQGGLRVDEAGFENIPRTVWTRQLLRRLDTPMLVTDRRKCVAKVTVCIT